MNITNEILQSYYNHRFESGAYSNFNKQVCAIKVAGVTQLDSSYLVDLEIHIVDKAVNKQKGEVLFDKLSKFIADERYRKLETLLEE